MRKRSTSSKTSSFFSIFDESNPAESQEHSDEMERLITPDETKAEDHLVQMRPMTKQQKVDELLVLYKRSKATLESNLSEKNKLEQEFLLTDPLSAEANRIIASIKQCEIDISVTQMSIRKIRGYIRLNTATEIHEKFGLNELNL